MSDDTSTPKRYETAEEYFESDEFKLDVIATAGSASEEIAKELGWYDEKTVNDVAEILYGWADGEIRAHVRKYLSGRGSSEDDPARKGRRSDGWHRIRDHVLHAERPY